MTQKFPLAWPAGWARSKSRKSGKFGTTEKVYRDGVHSYNAKGDIKMDEAMKRVAYELERLGVNVRDDSIVSTNLKLNLSGLPRGDQGEPADPGAAVYWQTKGAPMRVLAIDAYQRVRDNIAAIAATLEAMRAIARHGGAQIQERTFTGFDALPPPPDCWKILDIPPGSSMMRIEQGWRDKIRAVRASHPAGDNPLEAEINAARDEALKTVKP